MMFKKQRVMKNKNSFFSGEFILYLILTLGAIIMIIPFIWMILTSIKTFGETTQVPPIIFPHIPQWKNYSEVFSSLPIRSFYLNSVVSTVCKTFGQLVFCSMAAYVFARIDFPAKNIIFLALLSLLMVPRHVFLIPHYRIIQQLNLLNTLPALILPGLFSSFGTFLLRQFFMTIPRELDEAAVLDGCNHFQIYYMIMLPLAKPGLVALGIFTALWSWNDLLWPLIINSSPDKLTLSAGLALMQGQYTTDYALLMAGSVLAIWPMILLFIVFQNYFIEGIALTGTKV